MQYIILDGKKPTHKFKDGKGAKTWNEVKGFDNVAVVVPKGYVVLDFDTRSDADVMLKIVEGLDLKVRVMQTTRGVHVWFKTDEEAPKNFIKQRLAVGIFSDRKVGERNAYVKIKQDGHMRKWLRKTDWKAIETLPKWLTVVGCPSEKFKFKGMGEGSGRNQELFNYIVYLQAKGFTHEEIKETIHVINDYVFDDPLPESEVETICRDEAFKPDEEIAAQLDTQKEKSRFYHVSIAEEIIEKHNLFKYNGVVYEYHDGYYRPAELLRQYVRNTYIGAKNNQVNEVVNYIGDMRVKLEDEIEVNPYVLNLNNTRLDIRTGKCLEFNPDVIEFDRIPVTYDPSAYCADLDKMLNRVFLGDREVINLFEEMVGSCLIKHNRYQTAFMLYGSGANGKSTILDLIKKFLGVRNYSSIALEKVTDRFNIAELENKLANIGDDIDNVVIKDTGTLKKMFAGNDMIAERKGERPFTLQPYATHIYSANSIPRSFDKSDGFYRRWLFIPFNTRFSSSDEDYDPMIEDKITTEEALSYLLNIGIRGAKRLIKNGKYTQPASVAKALDEYKTENSTVLSWIDDAGLEEEYFLENSTNKIYSDFGDWCKLSGIKSGNVTGKKTFFKEVVYKFGFEDKPRQKGDGKRYFIVKID